MPTPSMAKAKAVAASLSEHAGVETVEPMTLRVEVLDDDSGVKEATKGRRRIRSRKDKQVDRTRRRTIMPYQRERKPTKSIV